MKLIAKLLLAAVTAACVATGASAAYPDKPIRLIVPFPAGGTVNLIGRVLAQRLSETLGQQVIVENKPGAGGTLGADLVAKSAPDGYTLLLASSSHQSIHPLIYRKLPYDASKDFVQVALFAAVPNVLVVSNKVPAKTVKDFVAYAKSGGKPLFMGSAGNGSVNQMVGELFQHKTGTSFEHVPFKGAGPAAVDLMSGQIDLMFVNLPNVLPQIQGGKMRALAVASSRRVAALPDVPTMAEAGIADLVVDSWSGVLAPAGTPRAIVDQLSLEINKIAKEKKTADGLAAQGAIPMPGTSAEYAALVRVETQRWSEVIRKANITLD
ncbi:Bug family tripartite tricarboxylate transporter substrate binding protein [Cupriavidus oxalaticus]|jgi:tripartite-type tricarboxylate transporter receptor subunit TctC|uniref:Extra-cytoplasmic solute receptor BugT n=1 Tax=Cupriavidus oxalaticus TaxID=96344 RepID=A0A375FNC6_9BURK|nr:tripartite tricarboxylate transporter substrate binding protein [Cupriavidus oxalaticus]QEZ43214.1 tripartite tricarboxylate transporter substrate binding protein [Cupriavidus oxalaticus]QRQ85400.1 tripartite tricarboxylate transporter substrate binding protein [Cupriavidus oxalaticus]QRQ90512.1 tripartite tricarboxylate transporter substrate binding protein [Cupriavidus oxalaticus]WQD85032.1 tripartite tricarboxylate transporter substrate binding protein [Cupriavidus oxalaticus]SPC08392.1 